MLDKGQKWYDLREAEDIKKRWQEYTEELYKKDLHDPDNHDGPPHGTRLGSGELGARERRTAQR